MLLEWIDQKTLAGSNAADKKRIRSQAMKNFRRKQRAEREAAVTLALNKATRRSVAAVESKQEDDAQLLSRKKRRLESPSGTRNVGQDSKPASDAVALPRPTLTAPRPTSVPRSPTQWDCNVFSSPSQIQQIIGFCASYLTQVRPVTLSHATVILKTAWDVSPCPMLLAAGSLAAAGDIEGSCQPEGIYKAQVLHELGERIKYQETAMSDETVCALMFLTMFDLSRSNDEARTHLRALRDILKEKFSSLISIPTSYSMMLEVLDLLQSLIFDTPLLTHDLQIRISQVSAWEMSENLSALLTADTLQATCPHLTGLNNLLSSAFASVQATIINATMGGSIFDTFYESLEDFRRANCRDETGSYMARVCYHQQAVLYNLVANGRPYRHASNHSHVVGLINAIRADGQEPWDNMPFLRIMVLLTGLAASREAGHKAFFKTRLVNAMYKLGPERWSEAREFVVMFLLGRNYLQKDPLLETAGTPSHMCGSSSAVSTDSTPRDIPTQSPKPSEYRPPRLQQLLTSDITFHNVIRQGGCALIEDT